MSVLPPKADIADRNRHVRFVPKADIAFITQRMDAGFEHDAARRFGASGVQRSRDVRFVPEVDILRSGTYRWLSSPGLYPSECPKAIR
jgi:hypothetical protein